MRVGGVERRHEDQSQALLALTAPPGSDGDQKLRLLGVLGQQRFTRTAPE